MTITELSLAATDQENFSREGEVVVQQDDGSRYAVNNAWYDEDKKELVIEIA